MSRNRFFNVQDDEQHDLRDPALLRAVTAKIADEARHGDVPIALAGGLAMHHYGSPRLTGDVDVIAERPIATLPVGSLLTFGGERTEIDGVEVDVIVRDDKYKTLYEEALAFAVSVPGLPMAVVSPEYLAAMKMAARRRKDEHDLTWLLEHEKLDVDRTRQIIDQHLGSYGLDEFDELVVDVQLEQDRQQRLHALKNRLTSK